MLDLAAKVVRPRSARFAHYWVKVRSLAWQDAVVVKGRLTLEVPLADHCGLVAGVADQVGYVLAVTFEVAIQGRDAIDVAVLSGEKRCAAWSADRIRAKSVLEQHPTASQFVEFRCGVQFC